MGRQYDQHRGALTRRLRWFWLLGAVGLLGVAALCWRFLSASHSSEVLPGTVVFEMQPTLLVKLEYSTPNRRVTVTRPNDSDDPFSVVVTDAAGQQVERCQAGNAFQPVLAAITKIVARQGLPTDQPVPPEKARLRLEDATDIGPVEWRVAESARGMVLTTPEYGYVVETPVAIFSRLEAGCTGLSGS